RLSLSHGGEEVMILPAGASGEPIAGIGKIGPAAGATVPAPIIEFLADINPIARSFGIVPNQTGSTSFDMTWGNVTKTFDVIVGPGALQEHGPLPVVEPRRLIAEL